MILIVIIEESLTSRVLVVCNSVTVVVLPIVADFSGSWIDSGIAVITVDWCFKEISIRIAI